MDTTIKKPDSSKTAGPKLPGKPMVWIIVGAIVLILVIWMITGQRSFVSSEEKVTQTWADVQSNYQRRLDLIPNLVGVVKGISNFESTTLIAVTEARSKAQQSINVEPTAENFERQSAAQDSLAATANRLIATIESYPELKGTSAYRQLQSQLEGTERRIKIARTDFNEAVNKYNVKVRSFPSNILAGLFGFKRKQGFRAEAGADKAVEIKF